MKLDFVERNWLWLIIGLSMFALGAGGVLWWQFQGDYNASSNPGAIVLIGAWSICYAILNYKSAKQALASSANTIDVTELRQRIVVARTMAILKSIGIFGILLGGLIAAHQAYDRTYNSSWEGFRFLDGIDTPILVYDDTITIIYANDAAARFYHVNRDELIGKDPQQLHEWARPYITNYVDFAAEQMMRNTAARRRTLSSKSKVPMIMDARHNFGPNEWYITSHNIYIRGKRYLVTRFSRIAGEP